MDTGPMAAVVGRSPEAVRAYCVREDGGYDVDACEKALRKRPGDPVLLTAAEAEQYLGIPANRIYQWVFRRWLRSVGRRGRCLLFAEEHLSRLAGKRPTRPV